VNLSARMKTRGLLRDTTHLSIGQGFRLVIQAAYFVLVARALGPDAYGSFVTVVAMAALLGPFSGLGTPNLFIKNVRSGKRTASICWGNGLLLTVLSGTLLAAAAVGLSLLLHLKTAPLAVFLVCIADMVLMKVTELAAFGFAASDRMKQTSIQNVVVSSLRLTGIAALMATTHPVTLDRWVLVYLLTTLLGLIYAVAKGSQLWGRPDTDLTALREDITEGVFFSVAGSATTVYNDIDKIMLSKLADLASTGVYAAAYRVIDVSMTPIRSLAAAAYPRFFRKGIDGIAATYPYALSLIGKAAVYGSLASAGLWLFAPLLPHILGSKYAAVVPAVRWLALIPFLRCLHSFLADALSGAGLQRTRMTIQVLAAVINIALNLVILPRYSWRGAAWTSLGCDGLLVVMFWFTDLHYLRREDRLRPADC
jgi:O-antigen/teichoic acid export membrane protein